ncbi:hypothetical protein [Vibrio sp. CK2-1]|uniref:hypothetical protein n=1 Tax=Vibrio sp. CK2-1 TaxID=2912249 RepID=UPI001F39A9F5|nr:hypothetical protein [Vibrio sp. CK2-1]MCF7355636.1 hypothetical protein [Vibrio sp. CK2-1]
MLKEENSLIPDESHWSVSFKGVSVWSYFRSTYQQRKILTYKPRVDISLASLTALWLFLTLRFRRQDKVVLTTSRDQLNQFIEHHFDTSNTILFQRSEQLPGNVFFIELIWFLFRKCTHVVKRKERNALLARVNQISNSQLNANLANQVVGDFYYNRFLHVFLKGKQVYYSNCVIPKIEKYMNLHACVDEHSRQRNSTEIQHGVISFDHPDYANIPTGFIKGTLLVWNEFWAEKLVNEVGYGGVVEHSDFNEIIYDSSIIKTYDRLVYSTVSDIFSHWIVNTMSSFDSTLIQKHPRDFFPYPQGFKIGVGINPFCAKKVFIHDSTLITMLIANQCFFYYVILPDEEDADVKVRLMKRYGAVYQSHYLIYRNIE